MATLNIGGQRVKVGDEFMQLSPEQQNATVEEIAASLPKQQHAPDDHGKARRDAMSVPEKIASPITEYPTVYAEMNKEARDQMGRGVGQLATAVAGDKPIIERNWEGLKGAGNLVAGGLGYVTSPINAAFRSQFGNPVEDATGIPREYTEFATQLATPGVGLTRMPARPGAPVNPGNVQPRSVSPSPVMETEGLEAGLAAQRLNELGIKVDVPRAITSDNLRTQRTGQGLSNTPVIGDPMARAVHNTVPRQIQEGRDALANQYGNGTGANVANRAGNVITEAAAAETRAATNAARTSDDAVIAAHQRATDNTLHEIGQAETRSLEQARAAVGDMSPQDMGQTLITRLQAGEQEAQAVKNRLYQDAGQSDATIDANAVRNVRNHVNQAVHRDGVVVDPGVNGVSQTPAARSMLVALDRYAELRAPENMVAPGGVMPAGETAERAALSIQGIDQMRKHLRSAAQNAVTLTDRRAASSIMRAFESWETHAFDNSLFSGSAEGLATIRRARAANADLMHRFGYNADPGAAGAADRILNRIATGEVTPQEVSNWLVGASQVGAKGESSRLLHRITEATRGDPEALQAIRGGVWNRLSQATEGATAKPPEKIASGIHEFLNGSGRVMARELFTPEQQELMRAYANTLRRGQEARELTAEVARNTRPGATEVPKGPMQQLADRVIKGQKYDEALFSTIEGFAQKGGDVKALAGLMRELPPAMRKDIASSIVRGLGDSARTGNFSIAEFANDWNRITPQAKSILFGNAGAHVKALDDLAAIADRVKDVKGKFGNPSGTAQTAAFQKLAALVTAIAGGTVAPMAAATAVGGGVVGFVTARVLASPAGAASLLKYAQAVERAALKATPQNVAAVSMLERNLANTVKTLGATHTAQLPNPMRSLQGAVPARAEDEKR